MKDRLKDIITYKTGGRQTEFCDILGWKPPYLAKLLKGVDFGIKPVMKILDTFSDIDARWFLLGTGTMLTDAKFATVRREMFDKMSILLDLEKYMPVMTADELHSFERIITEGGKPNYSPEIIHLWEQRLNDRERGIVTRFADANKKSQKQCRQQKAKL